jgi:hypothetical protein
MDFDGDDLAAYPAPKNSAELYSRFGRMTFASTTPIGTQTVTFGGKNDEPIAQSLQASGLNVRVETSGAVPSIKMWGLIVVATGGEITLWPPGRDDVEIRVPIRSLEITLPREAKASLEVGDYPHAAATTKTAVVVTLHIGDPENSVALSTYIDEAELETKLAIEDGLVALKLRLSARVPRHGSEGYLRVETLDLDVAMKANAIPPAWVAL